MQMKIIKPRPKPDKMQRKHLLGRIDQQVAKIERDLWARIRSENREEPPEVAAARGIVEAWEEAEEDRKHSRFDGLRRLCGWLRERVLFDNTETALAVVKQFEVMELQTALEAGQTMEDRNDPPLLGFGANDQILPPAP